MCRIKSLHGNKMADIVLGLFSPFRFGITEYLGYDITILKDKIRFLEVVVNRNGEMGGILPLFFDGAVCDFKELPKPDDKTEIQKIYNYCRHLDSIKQPRKTVPSLLNVIERKVKNIININY